MRLVREGAWFLQLGYLTIAAAWLIAFLLQLSIISDDALIGILLLIVFAAAHAFALGFCVTSAGYLARALFLQPDRRTVPTYLMLAFSMLPLLAVAWLVYIATQPPKV
jgi:hypothetical protein